MKELSLSDALKQEMYPGGSAALNGLHCSADRVSDLRLQTSCGNTCITMVIVRNTKKDLES